AVKHMGGFMDLVNQLTTLGIITESGSDQITEYADQLTHKWDTTFDANRAMNVLWNLSVDIGPRVAGMQGERDAANYLKSVYEGFGLDVEIQEFPIRDQNRNLLEIEGWK